MVTIDGGRFAVALVAVGLLATVLLSWNVGAPAAPALADTAVVVDDWDRVVPLDAPATRVAALSPHLVEMLFEIDAGGLVVAAVAYSDHPPRARGIPRVGDAFGVSREALLASRPDLVVLWGDATSADEVRFAEGLGARVFVSAPETLEDIAANMRALAQLTGRSLAPVLRFEAGVAELGGGASRSAAILIASDPLLSINNGHFIGDVAARCGLINVFGEAPEVVVRLSQESLLAARPDLLVLVDEAERVRDAQRLSRLLPDARLLRIDPDLMARPGPRLLEGARQMCLRARG